MDWWKIFSKSVGSTIGLTIIFPIVQIALSYLGVAWYAPLPPPALGKSFWGVPWGFVSRIVYPNAPYTIEWNYLVYDLVFWFIISFIYYSIRLRKKSQPSPDIKKETAEN
jgi:hypothetical protein